MFVLSVQFGCKHFHEVCLPGSSRLATVYAALLRSAPCPRCLARRSAIDVARQILNEPHLRADWLRPGQAA